MPSIAIITARGGSKRIPRKNIKEFCGKPILAYGIEAALQSSLFDEVMVSTDSEEIAAIACRFGAAVPFLRSKRNSDDFSTTADVVEEVITEYAQRGRRFETLCCIYPTAPFVTSDKLLWSMETMDRMQAESLIPVVRYGYPPQRALVVQDGFLHYQYPENERVRSQDLFPIYHDCGQFYFCRVDALLKYHSLVTPRTVPLIVPEEEVQDIDTFSDWTLAELKYMTFIAKANTVQALPPSNEHLTVPKALAQTDLETGGGYNRPLSISFLLYICSGISCMFLQKGC